MYAIRSYYVYTEFASLAFLGKARSLDDYNKRFIFSQRVYRKAANPFSIFSDSCKTSLFKMLLQTSILEMLASVKYERLPAVLLLSERETEILCLLFKDFRPPAISFFLSLNRKTVNRHIANIYSGLNT